MEDTYKASVYCSNCDFRGGVNIPKGQVISETACENCGNTTLQKNLSVDLGGGGFDGSQYY